MGKKAKAVRRQQRRAVKEAAAFVAYGPKETRGKYQEIGVSTNKLRDVAWNLLKAGDPRWKAVRARADAKFSGTLPATTPGGQYVPYGQAAREALRNESSSVFPRLNPFSGNTQTALINEIKQNLRSIQKNDMSRNTRFIKKPK